MSPRGESLSETEYVALGFIFAYRRNHGCEPDTERIAVELGRITPERRRRADSISDREWQERTARAQRERQEEKAHQAAANHRKAGNYRRIYERHCGPIPKSYHVHHKDGNHKNNDPRNLEAVTPYVHRMKHDLMGQHLPVIDSKWRMAQQES